MEGDASRSGKLIVAMSTSTLSRVPAIRRATPADGPALARLSAATFTETFGHLYPPEDLHEYLARVCTPEACTSNLSDSHNAVWLAFLEDAADPVGFIAVGRCKLPVDGLEPAAGEVKQLYVFAKFHNLRIGARLTDAAMAWFESERFEPLYVGVWSQNYGAQRFYQRYGFEKVGEYDFPVGKTVDHEFIMKRRNDAHRPR